MVRRAKWSNVSAFVGTNINMFAELTRCSKNSLTKCSALKNPIENEHLLKFETPKNAKIDRLVALQLPCFQQSEPVDKTSSIVSPVGWAGGYLRVPNKQQDTYIFNIHLQ